MTAVATVAVSATTHTGGEIIASVAATAASQRNARVIAPWRVQELDKPDHATVQEPGPVLRRAASPIARAARAPSGRCPAARRTPRPRAPRRDGRRDRAQR